MKRILTVTLNPAIDKIVSIPNFALGKDFVQEDVSLSAGGKGINVSRTLKNLGIPTLATGLVGGSAGEFISHFLRHERIPNDFLHIPSETRISLTITDPKKNIATRVLEPGPIVSTYELRQFRIKFCQLLKRSHCVALCGRVPAGKHEGVYYDLVKIAHREKVPVFLDTHGRPLALGIKANPFAIKPNLEEAQEVLGEKLNSMSKIKRAIKYFHGQGVKFVFISRAEKGAVGSNGSGMWSVVPPQVKGQSTVGSGDAFVGGFIAAMVRHWSFPESLRFASATGTANAMGKTPGQVSRILVQQLVKRIKISAI